MTYNFDYQITKDGQVYGISETAAIYLSNYLFNRVTSDKPLLEGRIAEDLLTTPTEVSLNNDEKNHLLNIILSLNVDNYIKNKLAYPITQNAINGVPVSVTRWQLRAQLAIENLEDNVTAAIESLPSVTDAERELKIKAQYAWDYANNIERESPTVAMIKTILGLTDLQVDNIFVLANQIDI